MRRLVHFFNLKNLEVRNDGEPFIPTKKFCKVKNLEWKRLEDTMRAKRVDLWNGEIYRLSRITRQRNKNILHLSTIDFKTHYATSMAVDLVKKVPFSKRPNGMYIGGYIKTGDDKLIFGRSSGKSIIRTSVNLIGGNLNKDEMEITSTKDLFNFFIKEFEEELGLNKGFIKKLDGLGIFISDNYRIGVIIACKLKISGETVSRNKKLNFENRKLIFLKREELLKLIDDPKINASIRGTYRYYLKLGENT